MARRRSRSRSRRRRSSRRHRSKSKKVGRSRRRRSRSRRRRSRRRKVKVGRPSDLKKYKPSRGCTRQTSKKYSSRPGPPYPANLCRGDKLVGNDGKLYASTRAKNKGKAYYKWTKV